MTLTFILSLAGRGEETEPGFFATATLNDTAEAESGIAGADFAAQRIIATVE
jgi:hypothetical protein